MVPASTRLERWSHNMLLDLWSFSAPQGGLIFSFTNLNFY